LCIYLAKKEVFTVDILLILLFSGLAIAGGLIGGFVARLIFDKWGFSNLERRLYSLENSIKGSVGVAARAEKAERLTLAIAEGTKMVQEGKEVKEVIKELAIKYPDVALDIVKRLGKGGGLGGLAGLIAA
jgi:hypothetical protein